MQPSDKPQFLKVLNGMAAMRRVTLIPEVLDLWWACMADWAIEDFKAAAIQVLKTSEFMPQPKDFEDLRKAGRDTAGEAWERVLGHVKSSEWRRRGLDDRCDKIARMLGGYHVIAQCDESKLHFLERRFCEHFEAIQDADEVRAAVPAIAARPDWLALKLDTARKRLTQ